MKRNEITGCSSFKQERISNTYKKKLLKNNLLQIPENGISIITKLD